jgi:hypothetical protein
MTYHRIRRSIAVLLIMLFVSAVGITSPAHAHVITCSVNAETPFRDGGRIYGFARRTCDGTLDISNFTVQLQRYSNGSWVNHGVAYTTSSTAVNLYVFDNAACYNRGQWVRYRTRAHWEGFHGTWARDTDWSAGFGTSCPY